MTPSNHIVQDAAVPEADYVNGVHCGYPWGYLELLTLMRHNATVGS